MSANNDAVTNSSYLLLFRGKDWDEGDTLDEALSIAKSCPGLDYGGTIEVRPVLRVPSL